MLDFGILVSTEPQGQGKTMVFACEVEQYKQGVNDYRNGKLIQDAFPFLSADEREFLLTGMTPEEWELEFGDEED